MSQELARRKPRLYGRSSLGRWLKAIGAETVLDIWFERDDARVWVKGNMTGLLKSLMWAEGFDEFVYDWNFSDGWPRIIAIIGTDNLWRPDLPQGHVGFYTPPGFQRATSVVGVIDNTAPATQRAKVIEEMADRHHDPLGFEYECRACKKSGKPDITGLVWCVNHERNGKWRHD